MINNKHSTYYLVSICKDLNIHTIKILYKSFSINDIDFMIDYFRYRLNTLYRNYENNIIDISIYLLSKKYIQDILIYLKKIK